MEFSVGIRIFSEYSWIWNLVLVSEYLVSTAGQPWNLVSGIRIFSEYS